MLATFENPSLIFLGSNGCLFFIFYIISSEVYFYFALCFFFSYRMLTKSQSHITYVKFCIVFISLSSFLIDKEKKIWLFSLKSATICA